VTQFFNGLWQRSHFISVLGKILAWQNRDGIETCRPTRVSSDSTTHRERKTLCSRLLRLSSDSLAPLSLALPRGAAPLSLALPCGAAGELTTTGTCAFASSSYSSSMPSPNSSSPSPLFFARVQRWRRRRLLLPLHLRFNSSRCISSSSCPLSSPSAPLLGRVKHMLICYPRSTRSGFLACSFAHWLWIFCIG
jgi:hypothetical protein